MTERHLIRDDGECQGVFCLSTTKNERRDPKPDGPCPAQGRRASPGQDVETSQASRSTGNSKAHTPWLLFPRRPSHRGFVHCRHPFSWSDAVPTTNCCKLIADIIYKLHFHPLAKYPGPFLAKLTNLYAAYHSWKGDIPLDQWRCHQKYGPRVRYAPNKVMFNTAASLTGTCALVSTARSMLIRSPRHLRPQQECHQRGELPSGGAPGAQHGDRSRPPGARPEAARGEPGLFRCRSEVVRTGNFAAHAAILSSAAARA